MTTFALPVLPSSISAKKPVILSEAEGPRNYTSTSALRIFSTTAALLLLLVLALPAAHAAPPAHKVSGQAIYTLTKQFLTAAPKRFNASPGHAAAEHFIESHFAPEAAAHRLDIDTFSASTPAGQQTLHNIIVKFPGKKDGIIVLATHYETNYPLRDINFVGANDGACTTALLISLGEYYRTHPPEGYSIWLVFDDGEEAVKSWSQQDSLYGTRHLAAKWSQDGTLAHIKAVLVADMIGYKDLNITHDDASNPALLAMLQQAAKDTGHSNQIFRNHNSIDDDTVPFAKRGVPVLDLIDYEYGPFDDKTGDYAFHHTDKDTLDKLSPASLQTAADLFQQMIVLLNQH